MKVTIKHEFNLPEEHQEKTFYDIINGQWSFDVLGAILDLRNCAKNYDDLPEPIIKLIERLEDLRAKIP